VIIQCKPRIKHTGNSVSCIFGFHNRTFGDIISPTFNILRQVSLQNCDRSRDAYIIHSRKITACVNRKYFAECSKTTINSKPIQGYEWTSVKNKVPSEIMVTVGLEPMQVLMMYLVDSVKKHSTVSSVFQSLILF
jgi:hypothetical protein